MIDHTRAMEVFLLKATSLNSVITLWACSVCHKYQPVLVFRYNAPYAVSSPTLALLSSQRNTFTINFKICQHLHVYVLVGLFPYVVFMSVQYNPSILELIFLQHR